MRHLTALALLALLAATPAAWSKPARIVSMNLCADQLLIRLADPDRIRSVTWMAHSEEGSNVAGAARAFPVNRGLAEDVIGVDPDLILAGRYTKQTAVALMKRIGLPVYELDAPASMDAVRTQILQLGAVLQEPERAAALAADIEQKLRQVSNPATPDSPTAIIYRPNGFTVGRNSLADDILRRAGLRNLAAELGWESYGQIPIEAIVSHPPDFIILDGEPRRTPAIAYETLRHPALKSLTQTRLIFLPSKFWTCAGPELVRAVDILATAARRK